MFHGTPLWWEYSFYVTYFRPYFWQPGFSFYSLSFLFISVFFFAAFHQYEEFPAVTDVAFSSYSCCLSRIYLQTQPFITESRFGFHTAAVKRCFCWRLCPLSASLPPSASRDISSPRVLLKVSTLDREL